MKEKNKTVDIKTLYIAQRNYPLSGIPVLEESRVRGSAKWINTEIDRYQEYTGQDNQDKLALISLRLKIKLSEYEQLDRLDRQLGLYLKRQSSLNK